MHNILRVVVHEAVWKRQLSDLLALCQEAPVQEAFLMEQSHQLLTSPFPLEKHRRMSQIFEQMGMELRRHGVEFSINLATCVGHGDSQVPQRLCLPYQKQIGDSMHPYTAVYCMTDPEWVSYIANVCAMYAHCGPRRLMIDDDFRTLNHADPVGCFCPEHARLVSEKLGRSIDSQTLRAAVCSDTEEGRYIRALWMKVTFEAQMKAASSIERAVHKENPSVQVGLMNSGEPAHAAQGRDMPALLRAFAGPGYRPLSRPAGGAYGDGAHLDIVEMHQLTALSMCAGGKCVEWISEVENWPHSQYNKSFRITDLQMKLHALCGVDALSLNLYDYLATPFRLEPQFAQMLAENESEIHWISEKRKGKVLTGVGRPWKPEISRYVICRTGKPAELIPNRQLDQMLPLLGIPVQFVPGEINFLQLDEPLCYSDEELREFLNHGLFLDNIAAAHIQERGLGEYLGCEVSGDVEGPVMEVLDQPGFGEIFWDCALPTAWNELHRKGLPISRLLHMQGQSLSTLMDEEWRRIAPGMSFFHNQLGGCICVAAYPVHAISWLHRGRAALLHSVLREMSSHTCFPIIEDAANVAPFYYRDEKEHLLALVNCGLDEKILPCPAGFEAEDACTIRLEPLSVRFFTKTDDIG